MPLGSEKQTFSGYLAGKSCCHDNRSFMLLVQGSSLWMLARRCIPGVLPEGQECGDYLHCRRVAKDHAKWPVLGPFDIAFCPLQLEYRAFGPRLQQDGW